MYFGSVRFFRHLILAVLVLLIAVPAFFAIRFGIKYNETACQLSEVQAVIRQYANDSADQDQLVEDLSVLLNSSFKKQIPTFQLQVDNSMSTQLDTLHTRIVQDIESQMSVIKQDLSDSLTEEIESLTDEQAQMQNQLTVIKNQSAALEKQLKKQADDKTQEILGKIDTLNTQIAALTQQINELKGAESISE